MNKIGIRAHDIGKFNAKELADKTKAYGFDGVQLVFKKAIDQPVDLGDLSSIDEAFKNLNIMMLGAYFNPVHPDQEAVKNGIDNFKNHLKIAKSINAKFVGSETGSYMGSPWGYMPQNHTDEALDKVIEIFSDLTKTAEENDAYIAIEGAYAHVAYEPKRIRKVLDKIQSKHLKVTIDLYNYLHIGNYHDRMEIFDECFELLKDDIVIFHLKDFVVKENKLVQVGLGQGLMDYQSIINKIKKEAPNAYVIFEGVIGDDIKTSYELIHNLIKEGK